MYSTDTITIALQYKIDGTIILIDERSGGKLTHIETHLEPHHDGSCLEGRILANSNSSCRSRAMRVTENVCVIHLFKSAIKFKDSSTCEHIYR